MKRAVAYARYSSEMQREESVDAQLRAIRKYCDDNGYVLVDEYVDRAFSAKTDKRPNFQKMIKDSSKGNFDAIIVHKLDRFARKKYDSAYYKHILEENDIKLISVIENFQDTPESVILESTIEGMNEYYSLNLSREVRKGLYENALACKVTGGPPALGYAVDRTTQKYVINEYEAEAVKLIFKMYLEGNSYGEIIGELNRRGYKTRRGKIFEKNSLYEILKNERYTGTYIYIPNATKNKNKKYTRHCEYAEEDILKIPGGMPQIISKEEFEKTQRKMKERQHKAAKFSAKQDYLLSGKIVCGECGSPYVGNSRKPRPDHPLYVSYKCTRRNDPEKNCRNTEINREKLETLVLDKLSEVLFNPIVIPQLVKEYNTYIYNKNSEARDRIEILKKELKTLDRKIENTVDLLIEMNSDSLKKKLKELEAQAEKLKYELAEAENEIDTPIYTEGKIAMLFKKAEEKLKSGALASRRMIIDQYIDKIVIYPDKIEIYINFLQDYKIKETVSH